MIDKAWEAYTASLIRYERAADLDKQGGTIVRSLSIAEIQRRIRCDNGVSRHERNERSAA